MQCGVSAAFLGMAGGGLRPAQGHGGEAVDEHQPDYVPCAWRAIYNTDGNGGIPHIVAMMLVQTRPASFTCCRRCPPPGPPAASAGCGPAAISRSIFSGKTARSSATAGCSFSRARSASGACQRRVEDGNAGEDVNPFQRLTVLRSGQAGRRSAGMGSAACQCPRAGSES